MDTVTEVDMTVTYKSTRLPIGNFSSSLSPRICVEVRTVESNAIPTRFHVSARHFDSQSEASVELRDLFAKAKTKYKVAPARNEFDFGFVQALGNCFVEL
jgi:hypothetical protein